MKALVVRQPWAWAIASGQKTIENRTWPTPYRGPLLIVAGLSKASLKEGRDLIRGLPSDSDLLFGFAIATVNLVRCVPLSQCPESRFAEGPWCWILEEVRAVAEPFRVKGQLGLFNVPMNESSRVGNDPPFPTWKVGVLPLNDGCD